jgi:hypothetical protein
MKSSYTPEMSTGLVFTIVPLTKQDSIHANDRMNLYHLALRLTH